MIPWISKTTLKGKNKVFKLFSTERALIKSLELGKKIRVGRRTGNTHIFFWPKINMTEHTT